MLPISRKFGADGTAWIRAGLLIACTSLIASCASPTPKASVRYSSSLPMAQPDAAGPEYFSEKKYGVKASPRVANNRSRMRRGGGRYQVGKPYKVKGRWYYPKEDKNYDKKGRASWYGKAFHGRLTANGEVYDMSRLTAAHPTMPLPSYARVTNTENGNSVIVRVNDRGPFAHNRIIDLSARAAQLLDYTHSGTAKVRVQYIGKAPLHGQDDQYLVASYQRGDGGPGPSGLPGTMVASASPSLPAAGLPGVDRNRGIGGAVANAYTTEPLAKPTPVPVSKPNPVPVNSAVKQKPSSSTDGIVTETDEKPKFKYDPDKPLPALAYADQRIKAASAFDHLLVETGAVSGAGLTAETIARFWLNSEKAGGQKIHIGTFSRSTEIQKLRSAFSNLGTIHTQTDFTGNRSFVSIDLKLHDSIDADMALERIWTYGITGAFHIR